MTAAPSTSSVGPKATPHVFACLVGNGASIAYNQDLAVGKLTTDLLAKFQQAGASGAATSLSSYATWLGGRRPASFEDLVGPLENAAAALPHLHTLTALSQGGTAASLRTALTTTTDFLSELHRLGLGITLQHIDERARNQGGPKHQVVVQALADELASLGRPSRVSVATLNYDGLMHSGLLNTGVALCDLADGTPSASARKTVVAGKGRLTGHQLRRVDDMPSRFLPLIQLHGSVAWLRQPGDPSIIWKFDLGDLRSVGFWQAFQAGQTDWTPAVVLTDQKQRVIGGHPFSVAYQAFEDRLVKADRWLILGYGFGDTPVNDALRRAALKRGTKNLQVLVVDYNASVSPLQAKVHQSTGIPKKNIAVDVSGLSRCLKSPEWTAWKQ